MNLFSRILFALFFTISVSITFGQKTKLDSLFLKVNTAKEDTLKIKYLSALAFELCNKGLLDTSRYFCKVELELAITLTKLNKEKNIPVYHIIAKGFGDSYNTTARTYYFESSYDLAKENYSRAIPFYESCNFLKGVAACNQNIGAIYYFQGNYNKALEYYLNASKIYEKIGDIKGIADMNVNIGSNYRIIDKSDIGLEHYLIALKKYQELNYLPGIAMSYMNIGIIHSDKKEFEKALQNQLLSLKIKKEIGDKKSLAEAYCNIGGVYMSLGKNNESLENYSTALELYTEINDKQGQTFTLNYLGEVYINKKDYTKALNLLDKGLALSLEIGLKDMVRESYKLLSRAYAEKKEYKLAYEFHKKFTAIKDTLFSQESTKKFAEMNASYENDKKEKEIKLIKTEQEKERVIAEEKNIVQKTIIYAVLFGLLLVIVFAAFVFRTLKHTKHQKNIIETKQKEILDSIYYAKRIQTSLLPTEKYIARHIVRDGERNTSIEKHIKS